MLIFLQAVARAYRLDQTRPVRVIRLISSDTVEEALVHRALQKMRTVLAVDAAAGALDDAEHALRDEPDGADLTAAIKVRRDWDSLPSCMRTHSF